MPWWAADGAEKRGTGGEGAGGGRRREFGVVGVEWVMGNAEDRVLWGGWAAAWVDFWCALGWGVCLGRLAG